MVGPDGVIYPYPYAAFGPPGLPPGGGNPRMPPPQLFGAGMMPGSYMMPSQMTAGASMPTQMPQQLPINMPRRRTTSYVARDPAAPYQGEDYSALMHQR